MRYAGRLQKISVGEGLLPVQNAIRNPAILSYYAMRRVVGVLALALPFALPAGATLISILGPGHALPHPLLERSISDYYYTPVSPIYVGSLCVIAAFLMCSRGYDRIDEMLGYLAGFCALGVALFPSENPYLARYSRLQIEIGYVHTAFAALMFLAIAVFCLFLFPRTAPHARLTRRKRRRNHIYATCGGVIVACIVVMVTITAQSVAFWPSPAHSLLGCESLAMIAFGVAWLTKGEGLLRDKPQNHHAHDAVPV